VEANPALNKHQQKTEATKAKLFKAAQRVFARQGFEAASIDEIAKAAGFTRGAFYAHFKTKEDLFLAMLEERAAKDLKNLRRQLEGASEVDRWNLMGDHCVLRLRDSQWSLLQLEFKLYIARRGAKGVKIAERFQTLRHRIKQRYMDDVLPEVVRAVKSSNTKQIVFEALMDGLALQRAYRGSMFSQEEAERELRSAFDLLIEAYK
jgi:AcrR family transcriptional regulator